MFRKYAKNKLRLGLVVKACKDCHGPERPCLVDDKPATFHRWVEEDQALLQIHALVRPEHQQQILHRFHEEGVTDSAATIEKLRVTLALVEYRDGSVGKVKPELITFLDRREG